MLAYLQLIRLPTVFTAMADILLGFTLTHPFLIGPEGWQHPDKFFGLLVASCCLYLSGMVFNDVFDRKQDTAERPGRPIPSGRVSLTAAISLGAGLMVLGVTAAATVSWISLCVALAIVAAVLAYDGLLKQTPVAPVAMGTCRFLNVLLGASHLPGASSAADLLRAPQLTAAIGLGIYIVGVTVFARTEAQTSARSQLLFGQFLFNAGIAVLAWLVITTGDVARGLSQPAQTTLIMLGVIAFTLNRRALSAAVAPSPGNVQVTIKLLLLSYVMLDATLVYWNMSGDGYGLWHALATAGLIVPALVLSRFIPMT